jgi:hypothetical protein
MNAKYLFVTSLTFGLGCSSASSGGGAGTAPAADPSSAAAGENGADSAMIEGNTESLSTLFVASGSALAAQSFSAGELHALDESGATATFFKPAGCVASTVDSASKSVTHVFTNCTGPFGLLHLNGTVKVGHTSPSANELDLTLDASNFEINKSTLATWSATAKITAGAAGARSMAWEANLQGTSARGRQFSRKSQKTIGWTAGAACVKIAGSSDGLFAAASIHTDVKSFSWCAGACPDASSEITVTDVDDGKSFDLKFAGGPNATFTGPDGKAAAVTLSCQ